ncbi:MAG: M28 family metallopeptidase [Myxococcota bacterium]
MSTILFWLACTGDDPSSTEEPSDPLTTAALTASVERLVAIGPRMSGTPEEIEAAAAVEEMLLATGVDRIERAPFTWDAWQPGAASITVGDRTWEAEPLSPSPPTDGLTAALAPSDFSDQIALFSSDDGSRADQFFQASLGGAVAMVRVSEETGEEGELLVEVGHTFESSRLPAIAVDARAGTSLRSAAGEPATIRVEANVLVDHVSDNLLAVVAGTGSGWVAVTAHYDSWHPSESAADNALGTAMLIQLAARLAQAPPPRRSVLFLATAGEEQGLQGAFAWAEDNPDWSADIDQVINLDIPWADEGTHLCASNDERWAEQAADIMDDAGLPAVPTTGLTPSSDHYPFQARGADALWCTRQPYRRYHTDQDTLDRINLSQAAWSLSGHWQLLVDAADVPQ